MSDRTDPPRCTATAKSTGQRCKRRPHPGATVCTKHAAASGKIKRAAPRRLEQAEQEQAARAALQRFGLAEGEQPPEDLDPRQVLLEELFRSLRTARGLDADVGRLTELFGETYHATGRRTGEAKPDPIWQLWQQQREHLKAVAAECARAGVEAHRASVEAFEAELLAGLLRAVFAGAALGLSAEQRALAQTLTARHLGQLGDGSDGNGG